MEGSNLQHSRLSVNGLQTSKEDPRNAAAGPGDLALLGSPLCAPAHPIPSVWPDCPCSGPPAPRGSPVVDGSGVGSGCPAPRLVETSAGARGWGYLPPPSCRGWRPPGTCYLCGGGEPVSRCLSLAQHVLQALDSVSRADGCRAAWPHAACAPGRRGGAEPAHVA